MRCCAAPVVPMTASKNSSNDLISKVHLYYAVEAVLATSGSFMCSDGSCDDSGNDDGDDEVKIVANVGADKKKMSQSKLLLKFLGMQQRRALRQDLSQLQSGRGKDFADGLKKIGINTSNQTAATGAYLNNHLHHHYQGGAFGGTPFLGCDNSESMNTIGLRRDLAVAASTAIGNEVQNNLLASQLQENQIYDQYETNKWLLKNLSKHVVDNSNNNNTSNNNNITETILPYMMINNFSNPRASPI